MWRPGRIARRLFRLPSLLAETVEIQAELARKQRRLAASLDRGLERARELHTRLRKIEKGLDFAPAMRLQGDLAKKQRALAASLDRGLEQGRELRPLLHKIIMDLDNLSRHKSAILQGQELELLLWQVLGDYRPVGQPLALISQPPRSGGTLLSQLFDGHPEVHAHPHELLVGFPNKFVWPKLDLSAPPERLFEVLSEGSILNQVRGGYRKRGKRPRGEPKERFRFMFSMTLQRQLFLDDFATREATRDRDAFDSYMTSFFNAWIDNRNLSGEKKLITAFVPGLAGSRESLDRYFAAYPDGYLISLVRDPASWWVSWRQHLAAQDGGSEPDLERELASWIQGVTVVCEQKQRLGERVVLLLFSDLVERSEDTMRMLARHLGLGFDASLLQPTFNGEPIAANTNFDRIPSGAIGSEPLRRGESLAGAEKARIEELAGERYRQARQLASRPA